jgi:formylmethanofuran dehydrogenase subunit E
MPSFALQVETVFGEGCIAELGRRAKAAGYKHAFVVTDPGLPAPKPARILASLKCEACGEMAMESRTRRFDGKTLCLPCFEKVEPKR